MVAGKSAEFARRALGRFFAAGGGRSPFRFVQDLEKAGLLEASIREARLGNYGKITRAFREIAAAQLDLKACGPEVLEKIHGIGPKTSRFFILWTRPGERYAALDTHVLKWLRYLGHKAPKATPPPERYRTLELVFLAEADARRVMPRTLDGIIWDFCSKLPLGIDEREIAWPAHLRKVPAPFPRELLEAFGEAVAAVEGGT
ncbi:hypothetical protein [Oleiharenicola sp. Vm1]|uniref:hypothetical protein n=1 Tax=Oleiharenicola sp. Vm1 TaxID=3398393 RepID=UPI0039F6480C